MAAAGRSAAVDPAATTPTPAAPAGTQPGSDVRRQLGAFYTPAAPVNLMLAQLDGLGPHSRILEPSGGDGAFVLPLLDSGTVDASQIDVWDLDPQVAGTMDRLGVNFSCRDSLLDPGNAPAGGYTHVIGNPPYLNKQSAYIKANKQQLRRRYGHIGVNETYALFTVMALERLAAGGQLVFLVSETFLSLGIHTRFRQYLLDNCAIDRITLLPRRTFPDAAVNTCVLTVRKARPGPDHQVRFVDCRSNDAGDFTGPEEVVPQASIAGLPGATFAFGAAHRLLQACGSLPPLLGLLDGGLGMHTGDNRRYLATIEHAGGPRDWPASVPAAQVDGSRWVAYYKAGGAQPWWRPPEFAVDWRARSQQQYGIPTSVGHRLAADGTPRAGFLVSGVASQLTARGMLPGALWDSNKVFAFFPKEPRRYPPEFFVAALNSRFYRAVAAALNHTVSLQIRDLRRLPLLPFTAAEIGALASAGRDAIECARAGQDTAAAERTANQLVAAAASRAGITLPE